MSKQATTSGQPPQVITVELTAAQVDRVVLAAAEAGPISVLLRQGGLRGELARTVGTQASEQLSDPRLSRSLLMGLWILALLPDDGSWAALGPLASDTGLSKSSTHRYVSTLLAAGLAERDPVTRKYRLVGLAAEHG
jgi:DNA-binding MarR family transcriptional regulator